MPTSYKSQATGTFYVVATQAAVQLCLAVLLISTRKSSHAKLGAFCDALALSGMIAPPLLFAAFTEFLGGLARTSSGSSAILIAVVAALGLPASLGSYLMKVSLEDRAEDWAVIGHPRIVAVACILIPMGITALIVTILPNGE